jgi:hypothetical protein
MRLRWWVGGYYSSPFTLNLTVVTRFPRSFVV